MKGIAMIEGNEEKLLRSVALQTSNTILLARRRAEHELEQAKKSLEERARRLDHSLSILRATIESTADGILVTDEDGLVLRFNELYLRMWPIPRDVTNLSEHRQLLKHCCKSLKDPQQFLERTAQIYTSWPADSHDLLELADGRVFEQFSKIQSIDGQNIGRFWNFRDVTARKDAEEAVRESSERLRFMAESMPHKIFTTRADGAVDYFNEQWRDYTGHTLE
ncbi:MAG: PAS domain-containing protein, partial [Nitrosospira sp.]